LRTAFGVCSTESLGRVAPAPAWGGDGLFAASVVALAAGLD
jgi:hypothetical protein